MSKGADTSNIHIKSLIVRNIHRILFLSLGWSRFLMSDKDNMRSPGALDFFLPCLTVWAIRRNWGGADRSTLVSRPVPNQD